MTSGCTTRSSNISYPIRSAPLLLPAAPSLPLLRLRGREGCGRCNGAKLGFIVALASLLMLPAAKAASAEVVEAEHGMVVSAHRLASEVGVGILQAGGNAIDAAVGVGYALAVVDPCCGNIGGGGFMTIHLADGRETFINFRETAPAAATDSMYLNPNPPPLAGEGRVGANLSRDGYRAAGVPGTIMGLDRA